MRNVGIVLVVSAAWSSLSACNGGLCARPSAPTASGQAGSSPVGAAAPTGPAASSSSPAQGDLKRASAEVTVFHLHKVLRKIGIERDTFTPTGDGTTEMKASFGFQDRGTEVPLAAAFQIGEGGTLR